MIDTLKSKFECIEDASLLNYNTNMQNNIKIMKKMYKDGLL